MSRDVAATLEDLEFLESTGVGAIEAARRTGFASANSLGQWLRERDHADLWKRLRGRDPIGSTEETKKRGLTSVIPTTDTIAALIEQGRQSDRARFRSKADRIAALVDELREALASDAEAAKQREVARKEVERLERQLAEAKARLRGGSATSASTSGPSAAEIREWAAANGIECPAMGRIPATVREAFEAAQEDAA